MSQQIPIQNIYYLLLYAWRRMEVGECEDVGVAGETELLNLLAKLFCREFAQLRRRWLDLAYVEERQDLGSIRGRIQLTETLRRGLLEHAQVACEYDELSIDTLPHQIIKATCLTLLSSSGLDKSLLRELSTMRSNLSTVSNRRICDQDFQRLVLHPRQKNYRIMMEICAFILRQMFPEQNGSGWKFRSFVENEREMGGLFEEFIRGFCEIELGDTYRVKRDKFDCAVEGATQEDLAMLPKLVTDVSLISVNQRLIIETKFTPNALKGNYEAEKLRRDHLSQLLIYLQACAYRYPKVSVSGLLLYPAVGRQIYHSYPKFHGHKMKVASLDLAQPWQSLRKDLLSLIGQYDSEMLFNKAGIASGD